MLYVVCCMLYIYLICLIACLLLCLSIHAYTIVLLALCMSTMYVSIQQECALHLPEGCLCFPIIICILTSLPFNITIILHTLRLVDVPHIIITT
jgi:hypothetical protein